MDAINVFHPAVRLQFEFVDFCQLLLVGYLDTKAACFIGSAPGLLADALGSSPVLTTNRKTLNNNDHNQVF